MPGRNPGQSFQVALLNDLGAHSRQARKQGLVASPSACRAQIPPTPAPGKANAVWRQELFVI